ncbi:MAG: hypothetical protein GW890_03915 [Vibrio sp.]|nr:hypothetical protein [Vibrio sp.]
MKNISTVIQFSVPSREDLELLHTNCMQPILLKDLDGNVIRDVQPPSGGWNADHVNAIQVTDHEQEYGYDVYLGDVWFGSSEM